MLAYISKSTSFHFMNKQRVGFILFLNHHEKKDVLIYGLVGGCAKENAFQSFTFYC